STINEHRGDTVAATRDASISMGAPSITSATCAPRRRTRGRVPDDRRVRRGKLSGFGPRSAGLWKASARVDPEAQIDLVRDLNRAAQDRERDDAEIGLLHGKASGHDDFIALALDAQWNPRGVRHAVEGECNVGGRIAGAGSNAAHAHERERIAVGL